MAAMMVVTTVEMMTKPTQLARESKVN
jgi:hypothetical protein